MASPRVFTIPPGAPFLATFAQRLLAGEIVPGYSAALGALGLSNATIYAPTRRAARALAQELTRALGGSAVLLPRILPLGGLEDSETEFLFAEPEAGEDLTPDISPAIGALERRMLLARLILGWASRLRGAIVRVGADGALETDANEALVVGASAANAWVLSHDLAHLIDEMIIEGVAWSKLDDLSLAAFDRYWGVTLDFLDIAIRAWPNILAERGLIDAAERQKLLIDAQAARLSADAAGPVIAIGSTGTNAATARLLAAIARAPQGAVVLPGLDQTLDAESFTLVAGETPDEARAGHPQAALARLLPVLGVRREDVIVLGAPAAALAARARFVSEALRPAETSERWRDFDAQDMATALDDMTLIEAEDEREEALALAVVLREALEEPATTAALVTPDRDLARRVQAQLLRWGVEIDDSGGAPLSKSPFGALATLAARASAGLSAADIVALLASPMTRLGFARGDIMRLRPLVEIGVLRGVAPPDALVDPAALVAAAKASARERHAHPAKAAIAEDAWADIATLLTRLVEALAPLARLSDTAPLPDWLAAHRVAVEALITDETGAADFSGEDGLRLAALFEELIAAADPALVFDAEDYALFFDGVASEATLRGPRLPHPRLKILGLLEARLMPADVMLLGGLDEGTWPPQTRTDAFLNRAMRHELGLSAPERRIGRTAHDFTQAMGAPRVVLSRARKRKRAPTVASRFLQRMAALAGDAWADCATRGARYVALARALDRPEPTPALKQPEPKPPLALRPKRLSVTRIETLRRDPYAIFAEYVLRLKPLDPLGANEGAREMGEAFHAILAVFAERHARGALGPNARAELFALAQDAFAAFMEDPDFQAFQWPRIEKALDFYLDFEMQRRDDIAAIAVERFGALTFPLADGSAFTLTATADRIETRTDGGVSIIDYKTGAPPSPREVSAGFAPQLTLEGAMAARGAFQGVADGAPLAQGLYVKLMGADGGKLTEIGAKRPSFADLAATHFVELAIYLSSFRNEETGYPSRPYPQFASRFAEYDHLARVKEWAAGDNGDEA